MSNLETLLALQAHDAAIDHLRHRRATLPQRRALAAVEEELVALATRLDEQAGQRDWVARRQQRLENEVSGLEARIDELDRRLYSGVMSSPRELRALQVDIEGLRRLRSQREDEILEAMEEREPLDASVAALQADRARLDAEGGRLRAAIVEAEVALDAELAAEEALRAELSARVPPQLLALYEQLRQRLDGIGAARLEPGGRCGGCHLTLPATEVARIKREPPDAVVQCDHCGRILVR